MTGKIGDSSYTIGDYMAGGFKHVINAGLRIPSGLANLAALSCLGEGCFRGVNVAKMVLFQAPYADIFTSSDAASLVSRAITMIRPYGAISATGSYVWSNQDILIATLIMGTTSIVLNDLARVACGKPPAIYNKVMSYIGPLRISDDTVIAGKLGLLPKEKSE